MLSTIPDGSAYISGEVLNELSLWVRIKEACSRSFKLPTLFLIQAPFLTIPFSKVLNDLQ